MPAATKKMMKKEVDPKKTSKQNASSDEYSSGDEGKALFTTKCLGLALMILLGGLFIAGCGVGAVHYIRLYEAGKDDDGFVAPRGHRGEAQTSSGIAAGISSFVDVSHRQLSSAKDVVRGSVNDKSGEAYASLSRVTDRKCTGIGTCPSDIGNAICVKYDDRHDTPDGLCVCNGGCYIGGKCSEDKDDLRKCAWDYSTTAIQEGPHLWKKKNVDGHYSNPGQGVPFPDLCRRFSWSATDDPPQNSNEFPSTCKTAKEGEKGEKGRYNCECPVGQCADGYKGCFKQLPTIWTKDSTEKSLQNLDLTCDLRMKDENESGECNYAAFRGEVDEYCRCKPGYCGEYVQRRKDSGQCVPFDPEKKISEPVCLKWTDGWCNVGECWASRGDTKCTITSFTDSNWGYCICNDDACVDPASGKCVPKKEIMGDGTVKSE